MQLFSKLGFNSDDQLMYALISMHYDDKLNQSQIANKLKCSRGTIIKLFKKFQIKAVKSNLLYHKCGFGSDDELASEIAKMYYNKKMSKKQIAEHFKVGTDPITWIFQRHNIKSRSGSEVLNLKYKNDDLIPTKNEMNIINGMLLGDGHIELKKYTALLCYTCKHEEVTADAAKLLNGKYYQKENKKYGHKWFRMNTLSYPFYKKLHGKWQSSENRTANLSKSPPKDIVLTPETCYWWYIGDGSTMKSSIKLCTHGFSINDVKMLSDKLPVESIVWEQYNKNQNKHYPIISICKLEARRKFLDFIGPCRHDVFKYKWKVLNSKGIDVYKQT